MPIGDQTIISIPGIAKAILHLPFDYNTGTSNYPLLVFLHGKGEGGLDPATIYNSAAAGGPAYFIGLGQWPANLNFIVVSPQSPSATTGFSAAQLGQILKYLVITCRVDQSRIYLTGLSSGGLTLVDYITHVAGIPLYPIAAAVPMSAQIGQPSQTSVNQIVSDGTDIWGFGSLSDIYGIQTKLLCVGAFNGNGGTLKGPGNLGRFTEYVCNPAHGCWNTYYNPLYTEVVGGKTVNIYQWMLQFSKSVAAQPPVIIPPVVIPPIVVPPVVSPPKTIKSITITYSDGSVVTLP